MPPCRWARWKPTISLPAFRDAFAYPSRVCPTLHAASRRRLLKGTGGYPASLTGTRCPPFALPTTFFLHFRRKITLGIANKMLASLARHDSIPPIYLKLGKIQKQAVFSRSKPQKQAFSLRQFVPLFCVNLSLVSICRNRREWRKPDKLCLF